MNNSKTIKQLIWLAGGRLLFLLLVIPTLALWILTFTLITFCELMWVAVGFLTLKTEYEWLQWTDRLVDWVSGILDRVIDINQLKR